MRSVGLVAITALTLGLASNTRGETATAAVPTPSATDHPTPSPPQQPVPYSPQNSYPDPWTQPYSTAPPSGYPSSYAAPWMPPPAAAPPAQPEPRPAGFHTHDGFFLRFVIGPGYLRLASQSSANDLQASGLGLGDGFSIGGSIVENLQLSWDVTLFMGEPSVTGKGRSPGSTGAFFGLMQQGPGLTYFFMPHNIYISGSAGLGLVMLTERRDGQADVDHNMNIGWGATLMGGKEWWTSDNWGLGASGRFTIVQSREKATDSLFLGIGFALYFSATYN